MRYQALVGLFAIVVATACCADQLKVGHKFAKTAFDDGAVFQPTGKRQVLFVYASW
ncbi:MAG: hypothetical protein KDB27_23240 [Planctomycetales bacterium]|nr:hypothetical protein [Planctomycetales bacterium]